jgi:group I intron endonuclease
MAESGIYEIVNRVNGKRYVGSATDLDQRWKEHQWGLRSNRHHSRYLQNAWAKYGHTAFEFRKLKTCPHEDLLTEEQAEFDRRPPEYNICPTAGSTLGRMHSEETKKKIGAKKRGLKMPPRSEVHRSRLSAIQKGIEKKPEHMAALQAARRNHVDTEEHRLAKSNSMKLAYAEGRHRRDRPEEYRVKIAESLTGRKATAEHRANQSAAQSGKRRGPYKLNPEKAEARREAGRKLAAFKNSTRPQGAD